MKKIIRLDQYFENTGEPTVTPVMLWNKGTSHIEAISKYASVGHDYFKTIDPIPGHSIVYVLAVSSWEHYGENRNGDGFPEFPYMEHENPPWIAADETLTQHYRSFEKFAHNYRHHKNKDPLKSVGSVMKAFWNPRMHRVELLVDLVNEKAPDLAERIEAGEYPPVSMGTKVKYDVCAICGNRAPTRAQYCNHLRFQMREVINGKKVCALNPSPRFFDISWVTRPADPTAYMLKKVAEDRPYELLSGLAAGEYLDEMESRKVAAHKLAVIDKVVQGIPVDAKSEGVDPTELSNLSKIRDTIMASCQHSTPLSDETLGALSTKPLPEVLSSALSKGITLTTPEVMRIVIIKSGVGTKPTDRMMDNAVAMQRSILGLFEDHPQLLDHFDKSGILNMSADSVSKEASDLFEPYMEKRSGIPEYLKRRLIPDEYRDEIPNTTPLSITDPASGIRYGTTRGAAIRAHDEIAKRNLYKVMGGTALLGGAYKLISMGLPKQLSALKIPAAGALGYLGYKHLPSMGEHYMTDQGIPIPQMTELVKQSVFNPKSLALPLLGTLGMMSWMGHDYSSRLQQGIPLGHPYLPLSRRIMDKAEQLTQEHPLIAATIGTAALHRLGRTGLAQGAAKRVGAPVASALSNLGQRARGALKGFTETTKLSHYICDLVPAETDSVQLPEIDIDKVAERIGEIIVEA